VDKAYWDRMVGKYEDEIFSSLHSDKNKVIERTLKKYGNKKLVACDFGCGIGHYSALLSSQFKWVYSFDLSPELIAQAKIRFSKLKNCSYEVKDLSRPVKDMPLVDFGLCANVLIVESYQLRSAILSTIHRTLKSGGTALFVLPSHESALYSNFRLFQWNTKDGLDQESAIKEGLRPHHLKKGSVSDGLINIDNVTTKHFLREEILVTWEEAGFEVVEIVKVEYPWTTEFEDVPQWMGGPYPWDWMVLTKKIKEKGKNG
jgi:SAM-dependent methyltransferase